MNGFIRRTTCLLFFLLSAAPFAAWGAPRQDSIDADIAKAEKTRDDLKKKIEQYKAAASKKAQEEKVYTERITALQQSSKITQQQIKVLELQSSKLQKAIGTLNTDVAQTEQKIIELTRELRTRMLNIYKYGSREELNLLLSAEDTHEAVVSAYLLDRLARRDQLVIEELLTRRLDLEKARHSLDSSRTQLTARTRELNTEREKYEASVQESRSVLSGVQRDRKKAEQAAKEVERAQREIGETIMALLQRKKAREQNDRTSGSNAAPQQDYTYLARGSMLDWPVRGSISSPFGSRVHPVFKTKSFNSGIDIRAAANTPVKAAGPGEVLFEGWLRGFGQVVIIDHGRNIATVYAHLASTRVKERDAVKAGTVVGTVGNTGAENALHFEVRVGDQAKNPLDYLKKT